MNPAKHLLDIALHAHGEQPFWLACLALASVVATIIIVRLIHGAKLTADDAEQSEAAGEI